MNLGLFEGAEVAELLTGLIRQEGPADPLLELNTRSRRQWKHLLNGGPPPEARHVPAWAAEYADVLPGSLPFSGADLMQVLAMIGFGQ